MLQNLMLCVYLFIFFSQISKTFSHLPKGLSHPNVIVELETLVYSFYFSITIYCNNFFCKGRGLWCMCFPPIWWIKRTLVFKKQWESKCALSCMPLPQRLVNPHKMRVGLQKTSTALEFTGEKGKHLDSKREINTICVHTRDIWTY